jgi:hypothetical protein
VLNLCSRLRQEEAPGVGAPWFDLIAEGTGAVHGETFVLDIADLPAVL